MLLLAKLQNKKNTVKLTKKLKINRLDFKWSFFFKLSEVCMYNIFLIKLRPTWWFYWNKKWNQTSCCLWKLKASFERNVQRTKQYIDTLYSLY